MTRRETSAAPPAAPAPASPDAPRGPVPVLVPVTREAREAVGGRCAVLLDRFPFRIGRAVPWAAGDSGRGAAPGNDLAIPNDGQHLQVSPAHMQIVRRPDGGFEVEERGSSFGTQVAGHMLYAPVGRLRCALEDGNLIVLGAPDSSYVFRFRASGERPGLLRRILDSVRRRRREPATPAPPGRTRIVSAR